MTQDYIKQIQKEFFHIKPHREDDLEWWNEGLDLIKNGKFTEAEKKFKMLIVSQPQHSDGFEGLAKVYMKTKRIKEAKYFINIAIEKVKKSIKAGETDPEMLDIILDQKKAIEKLE